MKTSIVTIIFASCLAVTSASLTANTISDEAYIDDIPFNTRAIAGNILVSETFFEKHALLPEECYVNDIPFDTEEIASKGSYPGRVFSLPIPVEEAYVDDIPFSTEQVALSVLLADKILKDSKCQEPEPYADDIPFDTAGIATASDPTGGESGYPGIAVTLNDPGIIVRKMPVIDSPFEFMENAESLNREQDHVVLPEVVSVLSDLSFLKRSIQKKNTKRISFYHSDRENMILQLRMDSAKDTFHLLTSDPQFLR